jgi:hypothetical protein
MQLQQLLQELLGHCLPCIRVGLRLQGGKILRRDLQRVVKRAKASFSFSPEKAIPCSVHNCALGTVAARLKQLKRLVEFRARKAVVIALI